MMSFETYRFFCAARFPTLCGWRTMRRGRRRKERVLRYPSGDEKPRRCAADKTGDNDFKPHGGLSVALRRRPIRPQIGRRAARLRLAPTPVQNPFGIAVRLRPSLEDEVARGARRSYC